MGAGVCLGGYGGWREGTKGKRMRERPAIHIRTTGKYAGYPARMLVFAWEGVGRKEERENEREGNAIHLHILITGKHAGYPARMLLFA